MIPSFVFLQTCYVSIILSHPGISLPRAAKNVIMPAAIQKKSGRPYKAYCLPQNILPRCKGASYYERLGASSLAASSSLRSWSTIAQTEESDQTFSHVSIISMMV